MLYVADMNLGRVHYFKNTNGTWAHAGDITSGLSVLAPYYDVAVSAPEANGNYSIFVSRKSNTSSKELLVYRYESGAVVNTLKTSFDLQVPTYLKVAGNKLCVALNGTDGDVKVYTISSTSPYLTEKATISNPSGVTANYGWNGLDVTPDNSYLYYIQAQNASETSTRLYRVTLTSANGAVTATNVNDYSTTSKYDGLAISPDRLRLATTYSGDGTILQYNLNGNLGNPGAIPPVVTSITPTSANWGENKAVVIKGEHFLSTTTAFLVNGTEHAISAIAVVSPTTINATIDTNSFTNETKTYALRLKNGTSQNELLSAFTINKTNQAPNAPTDFSQSPVAFGGKTNANSITFKFKMTDPNNPDTLTPQIRYTRTGSMVWSSWISGTAVNYTGTAVDGSVTVDFSAQVDNNYEWQARVGDSGGLYGSMAQPSTSPDFIIDRTPPKVSASDPSAGATGVSSGTTIAITFSEAMKDSAFNGAVAKVMIGSTLIAHTESYNSTSKVLTITPNAPGLTPGSTVKVHLNGTGQPTLTDTVGNSLDGDNNGTSGGEYLLTFTIGGSNSAPNAFNKLSPANASIIYTLSPTLTWENNGDPDAGDYIDHYIVTIRNLTTQTDSTYTVAGNQSSFPASLALSTSYSWHVAAFDKWGASYDSQPWWMFSILPVPTPTIDANGVNPNSGERGQTLNVEITGTGFYDQTAVSFSGTGITVNSTTYNSATKVTANLSISSAAALGARDVTVTNPGKTPATLPAAFTVTDSVPTPTITFNGINPNSGQQGQTLNVVITGTGFISSTDVAFSGVIKDIDVNSITLNSSTQLTANISIMGTAATTFRNVTVTNPGKTPATVVNGFKVEPATLAPTIKSITPNSALQGETVKVTIIGDNFEPGATVRLTRLFQTPINAAKLILVSDKEITCEFPIPALAVTGLWNVEVNQGGQSAVLSNGFTIISSSTVVPTVTSIDPNDGVQGETVNIVNIVGTNFVTGATVKLSMSGQPDINATNVTVANSQYITCRFPLPLGAMLGKWDVTVTNPSTLSGTLPQGFEIFAAPGTAPVITSITPNGGKQGETIAITDLAGSNFVNGATVHIAKTGETPIDATNVVVASSNQITCSIPLTLTTATGSWTVMVTNPDTQTGQLTDGFSVTSSETDPVVTIDIVRDGDTPGSGITITWTTDPANTGVDVYALTCAIDQPSASYTSYFTTEATQWVKAPNGDNLTGGTYQIPNLVGTGNAVYYKLIAHGTTLKNSDLQANVVGKFDLIVGPYETQPDKFFVSLPLEPIAPKTNSVTDLFGSQVSEGDSLLLFDMNKDVTYGSLYQGGVWAAFPGVPSINNLAAGRAYGFSTLAEKYITIVGKVPTAPTNDLSLAGGWDSVKDQAAVAEWIGNAYPTPVNLSVSGLTSATSIGDSPLNGGTAYQFNANADLINGVDGMAVNTTGGWVNATLSAPATLQLVPGKGYMLNEPVKQSFNWSQPKPY
ncbi:MAG: IPT/TIG domain-containing protein [Candidatus Margulisiibacteriota bacterium]